jgi:hypothetical protein
MHRSFARGSIVGAALVAASVLVGCGGGGGGGGGAAPPGTLAAVAVEGGPTPAGGTFAAFGPTTLIAAADGGWVAFVADVVGGTTARGLFVVRPNGALVVVYEEGETVPNTFGATGTIDDFERIWMRPDGVVVALVEIAGGSVAGVLTARVDGGGAVGAKATAIHYGRALDGGNSPTDPGDLTSIDDDHVEVSDFGNVYFIGEGTGGTPPRGVWAVKADGTDLTAVAVTNDPVSDLASGTVGVLGFNFSGLGLDQNGLLVAFVCDVIGGTTEALIVTRGNGFAVIARNGTEPPSAGGREFDDVHDGGPIVVAYNGSDTGVVTWKGELDGGAPEHGIFTRVAQVTGGGVITLGELNDVILPAETIANTGGGIAVNCRILQGQDDPFRWPVEVLVSGGTTDRVFLSAPNKDTLTEVFREGSAAPGTSSAFQNNYPSLDHENDDAQSRDGSFAFTAVLVDGSSGVWWPVFGADFFDIALEGAAAPGTGGGTFASFDFASSVSVAFEVLAFRAAILGGTTATAIFRQG